MGARPGRFRVLNPATRADLAPTPTAPLRNGLRGPDDLAGEGVPVPAGGVFRTGRVTLVPRRGPRLATYCDKISSSSVSNPVGEGQLPDNGEGKARARMDGDPPTPIEDPTLLIFCSDTFGEPLVSEPTSVWYE